MISVLQKCLEALENNLPCGHATEGNPDYDETRAAIHAVKIELAKLHAMREPHNSTNLVESLHASKQKAKDAELNHVPNIRQDLYAAMQKSKAVDTSHMPKFAVSEDNVSGELVSQTPDECRIELVTAIHLLASDFENALGRLDAEARKQASGSIAHARGVAVKWNRNGAMFTPQVQRKVIDLNKNVGMFEAPVAARKWATLQGNGYHMRHIQFVNDAGTVGEIDAWGKVMWIDTLTQPKNAGLVVTQLSKSDGEGWCIDHGDFYCKLEKVDGTWCIFFRESYKDNNTTKGIHPARDIKSDTAPRGSTEQELNTLPVTDAAFAAYMKPHDGVPKEVNHPLYPEVSEALLHLRDMESILGGTNGSSISLKALLNDINSQMHALHLKGITDDSLIMRKMTDDDGSSGWSLDRPEFYCDIDKKDGEWSVFIRDTQGVEGYAEQLVKDGTNTAVADNTEYLIDVLVRALKLATTFVPAGHGVTRRAWEALIAQAESRNTIDNAKSDGTL